MSRLRLLAQNVVSGYAVLVATAIYTLVSVRLALHYLSKEEFGLWALATQIAGYLMLIDLGMSGSIGRVLIDHKDRKTEGTYGSILKTGGWVLTTQGALIASLGGLLGFGMTGALDVPPPYVKQFQILVAGQCLVTGVFFPARLFGSTLQAHQRNDAINLSHLVYLVVNLGALWLGFDWQLGVYSLLVANGAGIFFREAIVIAATVRLHLFPPVGAWGRTDGRVFKELFVFGSDLFLLSVGLQLISGSQIVVISRSLGLEAAAVWSVATKAFTLAQQFVWRLWDYSGNAIAEMIVREERERVIKRFHDLVVVTASVSVFVGVGAAVCNGSLLALWTGNRIAWDAANDVLMAVLLFINSISRLHVGLLGATKKIRGMRYIYFLEGVCFVALSFIVAPHWGMTGIIAAAILTNIAWSGIYGVRRTAEEFRLATGAVAFGWLAVSARYALGLVPLAALGWWATHSLPDVTRFAANAGLAGAAGTLLLWKLGLTPTLRGEFATALGKVLRRRRRG